MDEASIRNLTALFADAAMRGDYESFRSVWVEEAEWIIGEPDLP